MRHGGFRIPLRDFGMACCATSRVDVTSLRRFARDGAKALRAREEYEQSAKVLHPVLLILSPFSSEISSLLPLVFLDQVAAVRIYRPAMLDGTNISGIEQNGGWTNLEYSPSLRYFAASGFVNPGTNPCTFVRRR